MPQSMKGAKWKYLRRRYCQKESGILEFYRKLVNIFKYHLIHQSGPIIAASPHSLRCKKETILIETTLPSSVQQLSAILRPQHNLTDYS
jgi:hypothetical protein